MIRLGGYHSIIYKENGDLFVFGYNSDGQLGLGDNQERNTPTLLLNDKDIEDIVCGSYHTIYYKKNGEIYVFGDK
jgi:alpha-tubulin suppressor-like RCC1 family protein